MKNIFKEQKNRNRENGFTLVEVLVSLSIFMLAITAMVVVSGQGINNTAFAKNQLTASYLAQEGIELVRNARDNFIASAPGVTGWPNFLAGIVADCSVSCSIDPLVVAGNSAPITATPCTGGCPALTYDYDVASSTGTGFYTYQPLAAISPSIFTRTITIDSTGLDPNIEVRVISTVTWIQGSNIQQQVSSTENLFNWRKNTP